MDVSVVPDSTNDQVHFTSLNSGNFLRTEKSENCDVPLYAAHCTVKNNNVQLGNS